MSETFYSIPFMSFVIEAREKIRAGKKHESNYCYASFHELVNLNYGLACFFLRYNEICLFFLSHHNFQFLFRLRICRWNFSWNSHCFEEMWYYEQNLGLFRGSDKNIPFSWSADYCSTSRLRMFWIQDFQRHLKSWILKSNLCELLRMTNEYIFQWKSIDTFPLLLPWFQQSLTSRRISASFLSWMLAIYINWCKRIFTKVTKQIDNVWLVM